jgi:hypothetical protein
MFVVPASNGEDNAPVREFNKCHVPGGNPTGGQFTAKGGGKCEGGPTKGKPVRPNSPEYFATANKDVVRSQTGRQTPLGREIQGMFAQNMPMQAIMQKARALVVARGETPEERGPVKVKVDGKEYEVDTPGLIARMEIESARILRNGDSKSENTGPVKGGGRRYTKERMALHEQILSDPSINNPGAKTVPLDQQPVAIFMGGLPAPLAVDTLVATLWGWTTMGKIRPGEVVFDAEGCPAVVESVSPPYNGRTCYKLAFDDGSTVVADAEHLWVTQTRRARSGQGWEAGKWRGTTWHKHGKRWMAQVEHGGECHCAGLYKTRQEAAQAARTLRQAFGIVEWPVECPVTTDQIRRTLLIDDGRWNHSIQSTKPLQLPEAALPIHPYVLGVWAGDGDSAGGAITSADEGIPARIQAVGYHVVKHAHKEKTPRYRVRGLTTALNALGLLHNKHIPVGYLRASEPQRRALLAGLLDTDGHATKHGVAEFYTIREGLAHDVFEFVASLGYKPQLRCKRAALYGRDMGWYYTVAFTTEVSPFLLERKRERAIIHGPRQTRRFVKAVEPVASVPVVCIQVASPSRLFLVGRSFIPTHNSGKTTAVGKDLEGSDFEKNAVTISNDKVKTLLPGYRGHNAIEYHEESSDVAVELFARSLMQRKNLIYDFTFKEPATMQARIRALKTAGYRVEVRFTDMDVNESIGSAMRRMAKEEIQYRTKSGGTGFPGRYSPIEHIRNALRFSPPPGPPPPRGTRTSVNRQTFERLKSLADAYEIKNNSGFVAGLRTGKFGDAVSIAKKGTSTGGKR